MKKLSRFLVAVVMMLCMTVSVMAAAPSPGIDVRPEGGNVVLEDGTVVDVNDPEELSKYVQVTDPTREPEKLDGHTNLGTVDIILSSGVGSAKITLYVPGVKKGDTVVVRIFINGQWVNVDAVVIDDNKVQVTVSESGTLEILKVNTGSGSGTGSDSETGSGDQKPGENGSSTSPKTGESNALPAAYAVFAVLGVTAVMAGYKAKKLNNK